MFARTVNLIRESIAPEGPLFSIIVATRNPGQSLDRSLESVFSCVNGALELLVIDGGSTDDTVRKLREHGPRVRWISEPDTGVYDAMNKGVRLAKGRWLLFLGAGDTLREGVLERMAPRMPRNTLSLVYGNAFMHDKGVVWDGPWTPQKFRTRNICHQAIFYGRAVFRQIGFYDTRFPVLADYELNMRCFSKKSIRTQFVDEVISDYEGGGMSGSTRDEAFYAARPALLKTHFGLTQKVR